MSDTLSLGQKSTIVARGGSVTTVTTVSNLSDVAGVATEHAEAPEQPDLAQTDVRSPAFAQAVGLVLRDARRAKGIRLRHISDSNLRKSTLKAAERGQLQLNRALLTQLASRYGIDLAQVVGRRERLRIGASTIAIGQLAENCDVGSLNSMLTAYLRVVDRARGDTTGPKPLRRDDIAQLADHLDEPCTTIIGRIGDLMEARGAETHAMIDLYLTGASVVGLSGAGPSN